MSAFQIADHCIFVTLFLSHVSRCVFVDAGVAPIDIETKRMKEEMKMKEAQARAVAEHGELALITVEAPQATTQERIALRPPMLQVDHPVTCYHLTTFCLLEIGTVIIFCSLQYCVSYFTRLLNLELYRL